MTTPTATVLHIQRGVPQDVLREHLASGRVGTDLLQIPFDFEQWYLPDKPMCLLVAVYECVTDIASCRVRGLVTDQHETLNQLWGPGCAIETIAQQLAVALIDFAEPVLLEPVHIPKPWGQEIWYTGMETRGQAQLSTDSGSSPLAWAQAIWPSGLPAVGNAPVLLKILDPLPEPVYGDLYLELHEIKQEVYVVTHIDRTAWPDGIGAIRFGFDKDLRAKYPDDHQFRAAFLAAVTDYRAVRHEIDLIFDQQRHSTSVVTTDNATLRAWHAALPVELQQREAQLRATMDSFTAELPLRVGDVLRVPCRIPHSLQHGVRTVEFQTPVYERKIIAFAQKVVTQSGWDTEDAIRLMNLDTQTEPPLIILLQTAAVICEQVVRFDDFEVQRLTLLPGTQYLLEAHGAYIELMVISGHGCAGALALLPEHAALATSSFTLHNLSADKPLVALLALPNKHINHVVTN